MTEFIIVKYGKLLTCNSVHRDVVYKNFNLPEEQKKTFQPEDCISFIAEGMYV